MNTEEGISKKEYQYIKNAEKQDLLISKYEEKNKALEAELSAEKAKVKAAEAKHAEEAASHEKTKKNVPTPEDHLFLHSSRMDNILTPILEGNDREPVFADSKDLAELKIDPIIHDTVHSKNELKTSNLKLEKLKEPDKEGKTIKISSLHKK